jgi:TonB family protein
MSPKFALLLASCCVLAASYAAAETPLIWIDAPTVQDMVTAYPARAKAAAVGGTVNLTCTLARDSHPRQCAVLGEQPKGYGFGFAARKVAEQLRAADESRTGQEVKIPVTFSPEILKGGSPPFAKPTWAALPTAEDFQVTFPKAENGVNSIRVVLSCMVKAGGVLRDCEVASEEPAGQGYGQGALALAPKFKVAAWSVDGQPTVGERIRLPIRYELQQVAATAKP